MIDTLLPESGTGFTTGNREPRGADQYGTKDTIDTIERVGQAWAKTHDVPFSLGDISRKGGGPFPPHKSHQQGIDFDVRPLRKDKKNLPITINEPQYDRTSTLELLRLFRQLGNVDRIFFNDQQAIDEGLSKALTGHSNHFHVRLLAGQAKPVLAVGSRGPEVRHLQVVLMIEPDGIFGFGTENAVKKFQRAHGLKDDGIVGPATYKALDE